MTLPRMDFGSFLAGVASVAAIWAGVAALFGWRASRMAPRVTVERDVAVTERVNPPDRYHVWGGSRLKRYAVIRIENRSSKPFVLLRGKLERTGVDPKWLAKHNAGVELLPNEATHFQLDPEEVGDLRAAKLTIYSHGWERTYDI